MALYMQKDCNPGNSYKINKKLLFRNKRFILQKYGKMVNFLIVPIGHFIKDKPGFPTIAFMILKVLLGNFPYAFCST